MIRSEMMERMSAQEFAQWGVFLSVEPFGDMRRDLHAAIIASTIANMSGKTLRKEASAADFIPNFMATKTVTQVAQSPEEMRANFLAVFNAAKKKAELKKTQS